MPSYYKTQKRHKAATKIQAAWRGYQARKRAAALRMKGIARLPGYRKIRTYAFTRETMPVTLPFTLIPAGASFNPIGYLNFDNLQFNQLVSSTLDFGNLFARYKVSMIKTILTPMFNDTMAPTTGAFLPGNTAGLRITRVNTKFLNEPFAVAANADDQLRELAQIQSKSVRPYASKRSMIIITKYPHVSERAVLDTTNTEIAVNQPMPWLNIANQSDVPLKHNSIVFAERTDGQALTQDWKYRVVHKIYFKCSQVG